MAMKIPFLSNIDATTKKMLIGGIASSLTVYAERLLAESYAEYPPQLKEKLDPHLPSNGELLTGLAPPLVLWAVSKKKANLKPIAFGSMLYSAPELIRRTAQNAAYVEGVASRPAMRAIPLQNQLRIVPTPNQRTATPASGSKYILTS